jgi:hypothetical protein
MKILTSRPSAKTVLEKWKRPIAVSVLILMVIGLLSYLNLIPILLQQAGLILDAGYILFELWRGRGKKEVTAKQIAKELKRLDDSNRQKLEFVGIYVDKQQTYWYRVRQKLTEGKVEGCEGLLRFEGNDEQWPTVWEHPSAPRVKNIVGVDNLRLFTVEEEHAEYAGLTIPKSLRFPSSTGDSGFRDTRQNYDECVKKQLTVTIAATKARVPPSFTATIAEMIAMAKPK